MTGKRWRLSFWPLLAFALVLPALIALGLWQLDRGAEKAELHRRFESGQVAAALEANGLGIAAFNQLERYMQVRLKGRYLERRHVLLDHMPRDGVPGHHVLTPFQPDGAAYVVMVDRGWRAGIASDAAPPSEASGEGEITGMLAPFPRPALLLEGAEIVAGWPKPMQFPQPQDVSAVLGVPVAAHRLLLAENEPDGFRREWAAPGFPPARHYAYAFQWFALAFVLIVIAVAMAWPRQQQRGEEK